MGKPRKDDPTGLERLRLRLRLRDSDDHEIRICNCANPSPVIAVNEANKHLAIVRTFNSAIAWHLTNSGFSLLANW
jgi:hypothetical protein